MAPSIQSQEPTFTMGSAGPSQAETGAETQSSLLFKMKPPKRPLRAVRPGDGFGKGRLKTEETDSGSKYIYIECSMLVFDMYCTERMCVCADPQEAQRTEIMKLKRRFLKDRKITSAFFAKTESRKKIMREVLLFVFGYIYIHVW